MRNVVWTAVLVCLATATSLAQGKGRVVDADNNGIPDVGVVVNGHYTSLYAYDATGNYYWDLGDGRVFKTVADISDLDPSTLTRCDYVINYRGTFENTPFLDSGWIQNHIVCSGAEPGTFQDLIVHKTDRRFSGDPIKSAYLGWGPDWEYHVSSWSGWGNIFRLF